VNHYLYAIVDRLPARWRPPTAGILGASIVPRRFETMIALASTIETAPAPGPRSLALHQDIVATVMDAPAVVPLPYGTVVPGAQLGDWIAMRRPLIEAALTGVRGCVEMTVKLLRLDDALTRPRPLRAEVVQSEPAADRGLRALAEMLAERAGLPRWQYRPSGGAGNVAASVAFLVPRTDLPAFLARIAPVASHAVGVAVVPTGPSAPASFAPDLSRAPGGRTSLESWGSEQRRVG
jgi:gas vesicle protein GvpL/GvpF